MVDFISYIKIAYLDPVPKRVVVVLAFSFFYFLLFRLSFFKNFAVKLLTVKRVYLIILFALLLRVGWFIAAPTSFPITNAPVSESAAINKYSYDISKKGIPTSSDGTLMTRRPVGYPYLLGGLYHLFGYHESIFKITQILLGTLLVWITFLLGKSIFQNAGIGILAAFFTAIYPQNVFSINIPLDEYPFFVCWFTALTLISSNINSKTIKHTFWISCLLGLATAFRTNTFYMPFIILISYGLFHLPFKKSLKQAIASFFMIYLISSPWGLITYHHYGKPSFFSTVGLSFYGTLNDRASWDNGYIPRAMQEGADKNILNEQNPVIQANIATKKAIEWVLKNPKKILPLIVMRNAVLFGFDYSDEIEDLNMTHAATTSSFAIQYHHHIRTLKNWAYSFFFFLGLFGTLILCFDRRYLFWVKYPAFTLVIIIFIYWCVTHGFFFGFKKYRWAMDLFFIYPASFFLWWLSRGQTNK